MPDNEDAVNRFAKNLNKKGYTCRVHKDLDKAALVKEMESGKSRIGVCVWRSKRFPSTTFRILPAFRIGPAFDTWLRDANEDYSP